MASTSKGGKREPLALIIDDEKAIGDSLAGVLGDEGWRTKVVTSGRQGLIEFKMSQPDLVFLDVWMPEMDGIETLQLLVAMQSGVPIVIMSGHATIDTAVRATKLGAFDYIEKPLSLDKIQPLLVHAFGRRQVEEEASQARGSLAAPLIGDSLPMRQIKKQIKVVAPRNAWVLITGENGTGKEVVARQIQAQSSRADRPFIAVNCAAIPEDLIESELFGHVKGAFTGAWQGQRGKFELAHQGTIFLDEIGDMSLRTQAKILRVLQEQSFERLGGDETVQVDVRVIAATNRDLAAAMREGHFREDLFYRLNVVPFHIPALREREGDVAILVSHFLEAMAAELGEGVKSFEASALSLLGSYEWPGNVRELRNLIERLCIMVPATTIRTEDLPAPILAKRRKEASTLGQPLLASASLREAKSDFERSFILDKLQEFHWNVSKTAEAIGIERSNLHRKLRAYNIDTKRLKE